MARPGARPYSCGLGDGQLNKHHRQRVGLTCWVAQARLELTISYLNDPRAGSTGPWS
ncbi:hypothetical protein APTSU1_000717000 [Apodemus speciosus]|uniref:Uncharacterized protein n=1 Tax=Apodemus speciosus TaxID=105296 RepID=A0ABQ0EY33_APOSI